MGIVHFLQATWESWQLSRKAARCHALCCLRGFSTQQLVTWLAWRMHAIHLAYSTFPSDQLAWQEQLPEMMMNIICISLNDLKRFWHTVAPRSVSLVSLKDANGFSSLSRFTRAHLSYGLRMRLRHDPCIHASHCMSYGSSSDLPTALSWLSRTLIILSSLIPPFELVNHKI